MSIKETPRQGGKNVPIQHAPDMVSSHATATTAELTTVAGRLVAVLRIVMGLVFAWAFVDKVFGLGYSTSSANAWITGGSPTKGFLGHLSHGPFKAMFTSWAGDAWADWLFMLGLAGIAIALLAGIGLRIAAVSGTLMLLLMWAAEWTLDRHDATGKPTGSVNPIIDDHIVYAIVLIALAALYAGNVWGLGKQWAKLDIVRRNRWLI